MLADGFAFGRRLGRAEMDRLHLASAGAHGDTDVSAMDIPLRHVSSRDQATRKHADKQQATDEEPHGFSGPAKAGAACAWLANDDHVCGDV
ncbi:MAG: hypothetical protein ABMA14_20860 [Hyphomonadaceae bacterium]